METSMPQKIDDLKNEAKEKISFTGSRPLAIAAVLGTALGLLLAPNTTEENKKGKSLFTGTKNFLFTLAIGAGLGLLFAPKSGVETQKDVLQTAKKLTNRLNEEITEKGEEEKRVDEKSE